MARGARALIALALVACGVEAVSPEKPPLPPSTCTLEMAREIRRDVPAALGSIGLVWDDEGGLLALVGDGAVEIRPLGPTGVMAGDWASSAVPGATGLAAIAPSAQGALLLMNGSCAEGPRCMLGLTVGAAGEGRGDALPMLLDGELVTQRRAILSDGLAFAWSARGGGAAVHRWTPDDEGLSASFTPLGGVPDPELPTEILALAADGDRWAALWRRGATEDSRAEVFLSTPYASQPVEALHEALVVEAAHLEGDVLTVIVGFEFSRPHWIQLRVGRDEPLRSRELAPHEPPPAPIADVARGRLVADDAGLWLQLSSASGDAVGKPTRLLESGVRTAALARHEQTFVVAWVGLDSDLVTARVVCD